MQSIRATSLTNCKYRFQFIDMQERGGYGAKRKLILAIPQSSRALCWNSLKEIRVCKGGTWKVPRSEENIFPSLIINVFPIRVISLDKLPSCTTFPTFPQLSSSPDALTHACIDRNLTALHPFDPWLRSSHRFEPTIAPFAAIPSFSPLRLKQRRYQKEKKEKRGRGKGEQIEQQWKNLWIGR